MSNLLPTLMLLFDGKSNSEVSDAICAYFKGKTNQTFHLIQKLDVVANQISILSYSVDELLEDIDRRNDEEVMLVCDDKIALDYITDLRNYRKMEYAYDAFVEARDAMIDEMDRAGYIVSVAYYNERNAHAYWGG